MGSTGRVSRDPPHHPSDLIASARLLSAQQRGGGGGLNQPATSNPRELITADPLIDVSASALSTGDQLVRPGAVPFMSCRADAYGRLFLATHERRLTGGLVTCDWFRREGVACGSSNQHSGAHRCRLPRLQWLFTGTVYADNLPLSHYVDPSW